MQEGQETKVGVEPALGARWRGSNVQPERVSVHNGRGPVGKGDERTSGKEEQSSNLQTARQGGADKNSSKYQDAEGKQLGRGFAYRIGSGALRPRQIQPGTYETTSVGLSKEGWLRSGSYTDNNSTGKQGLEATLAERPPDRAE